MCFIEYLVLNYWIIFAISNEWKGGHVVLKIKKRPRCPHKTFFWNTYVSKTIFWKNYFSSFIPSLRVNFDKKIFENTFFFTYSASTCHTFKGADCSRLVSSAPLEWRSRKKQKNSFACVSYIFFKTKTRHKIVKLIPINKNHFCFSCALFARSLVPVEQLLLSSLLQRHLFEQKCHQKNIQ